VPEPCSRADPTRLFRVLREASGRASSGRLHLVSAHALRQLRLQAGAISDACSDVAGEKLGDVLLERGAVSLEDLRAAVEVALRDRRLVGRVLLERGLVSPESLGEAVADHVRCVARAALAAPDLGLAFEETPDEPVDGLECPVPVGQLLLDLSRELDPRLGIAAMGGDGRALTLAADRRLRSQALALSSADAFVLSRVDGTLGVADLGSVVPLSRQEIERSLFGLLSTGLVEFADVTARPRAGPGRPRTAPPAPTAPPPAPPPSKAPAAPQAPRPPTAGIDETESHSLVDSARELVTEGCAWDAIQRLEPVLTRLAPSARSSARVVLASAYARNPNWRHRAEEALRVAIQDGPNEIEPRLALAALYLDLGLPARAGAVYRAVLEIDPRNATARRALAGAALAERGATLGRSPGRG
jgi:hypothetical protein